MAAKYDSSKYVGYNPANAPEILVPARFAQPNSLEFDFALQWREMEFQHLREMQRLHEMQQLNREKLHEQQQQRLRWDSCEVDACLSLFCIRRLEQDKCSALKQILDKKVVLMPELRAHLAQASSAANRPVPNHHGVGSTRTAGSAALQKFKEKSASVHTQSSQGGRMTFQDYRAQKRTKLNQSDA